MTTENTSHASGFLSKFRFFTRPIKSRPINSLKPSVRIRIACLLTALAANHAILSALGWNDLGEYLYPSIILGSIISYAHGNKRSWPIIIGKNIFMIWVCWDFLQNISPNHKPTIFPLIKLLLLLHAGHCFDMPKRRDLNNSLFASFAMLAITAAIAPDFNLDIHIILYGLLFIYILRIYNYPWKGQNSNLIILFPKKKHYFSRSFSAISLAVTSAYIALMLFMLITPKDTIEHFNQYHWQYFHDEKTWIPDCPERIDWDITSFKDFCSPNKSGNGYFSYNNAQDLLYIDLDVRAEPGDKLVMLMYSSKPVSRCRGIAYSKYDGHHWNVSQEKPWLLPNAEKTSIYFGKTFQSFIIPNSLFGSISAQDTMCVLRDGQSSAVTIISRTKVKQNYVARKNFNNYLFTPLHATNIYFPTDEILTDSSGNMILPSNLKKNVFYKISGDEIDIAYMELKTRKILSENPYESFNDDLDNESIALTKDITANEDNCTDYAPALEEFLQLPETVTDRTYKLAKALTAEKDHNYFKAEILAKYLKKNCKYKLIPPEYPQDKDCADWFIFEAKLGNCTQFATALTVLCRAANVPARFVTGYLLTDSDLEDEVYYIREQSAHGWTEIFLPEFGWVPFDATPPADENTQSPDDQTKDQKQDQDKDKDKDKEQKNKNTASPPPKDSGSATDNIDQNGQKDSDYLQIISQTCETAVNKLIIHQTAVLYSMLFFMTAAWLIIVVRRKLLQSRREKRYGFITFTAEQLMKKLSKLFNVRTGEDNKDCISRIYAETLYLLSRKGICRPPSQTPRSFAGDNESLSSCLALNELTAMLEEEQYGNVATDDLRKKQAEQYLEDIQIFCRSLKPLANSRVKTNAKAGNAIAEKDNVSHNSQKEINE